MYVCEYQIDRNQRSFEKIHPKNRYYINTEPYMFNEFAKKLELRRTFTVSQGGGRRWIGMEGELDGLAIQSRRREREQRNGHKVRLENGKCTCGTDLQEANSAGTH